MKALVFEPHNDDLVIGVGGTALKMMEEGWEFKTVLMTDGRYGSNEIPPEELVDIRRGEKQEELDFLGISGEFLSYEDGSLLEIAEEQEGEIVSKLEEIINGYDPDIVFTPARNESHPDHVATNLLVDKAVKASNPEPLKISYIVWQKPFNDEESNVEKVVKTEVEDVYDQKLEALRRHESQIEKFPYDEMVESFNKYLGLVYASSGEDAVKSEALGVQNPGRIEKLEGVEFEDVTELSHGRETEQIGL